MPDLDSLNLVVRASTKEATDSIDRLIETLGKLGAAFDVQSVDGFAASLKNMANAINSIKGYNLKVISDAVAGLSKASKTMSTVSQSAAKSGTAVDSLTKKLADIVNITDKTGLSMLKKEVDSFLHATNGDEVANARHNINVIAKTFGTVGAEIDKDRERALAFINALNNTKINLPKDWTKEFGDTDYAKKLRGLVGLGRTVGDGSGSDASEIAERLGLGEYHGQDAEAFRDIAVTADLCRQKIEETNDGLLTLDDALRSDGEAAREAASAMQAFNEKLANTLGMTSEQMKSIGSADGFLEDYETQNIALEQFTQNAEKLLAVGNPYQNIVDGLNEMGNVSISPETLESIDRLRTAVEKIGGKSGSRAGQSMQDIAKGLQSLNVPVPEIGDKVAELAAGLRKLGSGNMVKAASSLPFIAQSLHHLNSLQLSGNASQIAELAHAVAGFGYAKVEQAVANLPLLTQELMALIGALSRAPQVSNNTLELVKALGAINVNARQLTPTTRRAGNALDLFSKKAKKAHKASFSLAATIGKIYASYWTIIRLVGMFRNSIDIASDLTEVQNVVDHTFGQMKNRMEDFSKTAVESIGMSELTAKEIGSRFQSMGRNMAIPNELIQKTGAYVDLATNGYGDVAESMADVSINLTRLAGDMASFYNVEYKDVAEDLEAVFTGMTRPLRKYGLDLTVATLKEYALARGMNADIKNMTQAEKTMLRYQYVMENTTAAHGDFEETISTWANQTKIAHENLKRLQVILGQIGIYTFKPLVSNFNAAMNDILHLAESTFNALGTIFGWQIEVRDVGIIDDMADGMGDVADGYDDAADEAKKFKNFLLGIDELNLLPDNKDNGSGDKSLETIGAISNGIEDSLVDMKKVDKGFDSIYDTLFKLGRRIGEVQLDWLKNIDWDSIYKKAEGAGKGLASFLNGYLADAELFYHKGRFIANGINTVAHAIYGFFHEFDGYQLGKDLGFELNGLTHNLDWDIIQSGAYEMAHDVTEFFNGIIENVNWNDVGRTIAEAFNTFQIVVSTFWNEIKWDKLGVSAGQIINSFFLNWNEEEAAKLVKGKIQAVLDFANNLLTTADFVMIGEKIGKFLSELNITDFMDDIALLIKNLIEAAFELYAKMAEEAPIETALLTAFGVMKFSGLSIIGGNIAGGIMTGFTPKLVGLMTTDLAVLATSGSLLSRAGAIGLAIGGSILAAIGGMNLGLEIGKRIFPEDEMWYDEFENDLKEYFSYRFNLGSAKITGSDKEITGHSKRERTRYDISNGKDISEMYSQQRFGQWKQEQNNAARQAAREHEETVGRVLAGNQRIQLAIQSGVMTVKEATEAYDNMNHASVYVRKSSNETATAVSELTNETEKTTSATENLIRMFSTSGTSLSGGANNIDNIAKRMEYLHTNLLTSKVSMDALSASFETIGAKKDKAGSLTSVFDNAKEKITEVANVLTPDKLSNMFNGIPEAFRAAWQNAINVMKSMWSQMANWINSNAKIEIPKTKVGNQEIGGQTVQLKIPRFDVGGSIPNNGNLFFANERGAEVVANMGSRTGVMNTDQMEAAIANGMMKALAAGGQNVTVVLEGDASNFFTAMVRENNNAIMRVGASPLRV